jgi:hypothetical protein
MINVEEEIIIDSTIATKDLKVKLDNKQGVTVARPSHSNDIARHYPRSFEYSS